MIAATSAVLLGMTLEQAREALETPVPGKCFFLGGHCDRDAASGDWLCPEHRAWTPNIATRDARNAIYDDDDFEPVEGPSLAAVHRQWLDRGLPSSTWPAYLKRMREVT